jgi:hypothetical protein
VSLHPSLSVASTKDGKDVGLSKEVDVISAEEETASNIPKKNRSSHHIDTLYSEVPPPQAVPLTSTLGTAPPLAPRKILGFLLRPSTSSSASGSPGPSRDALPTSSVVGISIPGASATTQDAALHVSPSRRSELVRLLTSGPGPGTAHTTTAISYAGSAASTTTSTTTTANLTPSTKIRPPGLDQLWQHVFCQLGVADHGVLSAFSSVVCRIGEGAALS